jgi:hypothetical protein
MIVVILSVAVVTVLGGALVAVAIRDLESSGSVQRASTALGMGEAGVQHVLQKVKVEGPPQLGTDTHRLQQCVADASDDNLGQFVNPDDVTMPPVEPADSTDTDNCGPYEGLVGNGKYTVYLVMNPGDTLKLPEDTVGSFTINAVGFDRVDNPTRPGERTVQQSIRVQLLDLPFGLFAADGSNNNGTPTVLNQSLWTLGDVKFRDKIDFDADCPEFPTGCDLFYGFDSSVGECIVSPSGTSKCPAAVHAAGTIYKGNGNAGAQNGPIHAGGPVNCNFPYDRDELGGTIEPPPWPCASPIPPYSSTKIFDPDTQFPFDTSGPDPDVYQILKEIAIGNGTYCNYTDNNQLNLGAGAVDPDCPIDIDAHDPGFMVVYIDASSGAGDIAIKTGWGIQTNDPANVPCDPEGNFGIIVVRNGNMSWQNNETWWGAIFVPEGEFSGTGAGDAWIVGTVFAKTMDSTGNVRFQLNDCWVNDLSGPFFTVSRIRWHEADR